MFERGPAIPAGGLVGEGPGLPRARTTPPMAPPPSGQTSLGGQRESTHVCPTKIIMPSTGGLGDAASRSQVGAATHNLAPSHSLFLNSNNLKL